MLESSLGESNNDNAGSAVARNTVVRATSSATGIGAAVAAETTVGGDIILIRLCFVRLAVAAVGQTGIGVTIRLETAIKFSRTTAAAAFTTFQTIIQE